MLVEIVLFIIMLLLLKKYFEKPKGMPPGEWGWPLIGCLPPSNIPIRTYFENLKDKYGDIYTIKMGSRPTVIMSNFDLIKTAFAKAEFAGRPDFYSFRTFMFYENLGIFGSNSKIWHDNRRFALTQLKDLGLGKSFLEDAIKTEVALLTGEVDKNLDKPFALSFIINLCILNIIWNLVASKRYEMHDKEIIHFLETMNTEFEIINDGPIQYLDMFPKLIPFVPEFIKDKWMRIIELDKINEDFFEFIGKVVEEHKEKLDPDDPKDYIDSYILEAEKQKQDENSTFKQDYKDLAVSIGDLFVAGSETTSSSIRYTLLFLILNPDVQEKCQKEIDEFVPRDSMPSLEHRNKLVYVEATIMEVQRKMSLIPLNAPHEAIQDTTLAGYTIPKGTVVMAFTEYCHNDPKYWDHPEEFRPERFIDENGKLMTKKDGYLPFSLGRRVCIGESLAKMELFLFISALLQKYKITAPPNEELKFHVDKSLNFINAIKPYNVVFQKRI